MNQAELAEELSEASDMLLEAAEGLTPPVEWVGIYLREDDEQQAFLCMPSAARCLGDELLRREGTDPFCQAAWEALCLLGDRRKADPTKLHCAVILADHEYVMPLELDLRQMAQPALC